MLESFVLLLLFQFIIVKSTLHWLLTGFLLVHVHDQGQPEFLGRVIASPKVTLEDEEYIEAQLEWWDIYRGSCKAGQLLASFELLEVG